MSSKDSKVKRRNMGTRDCPPVTQTGYPWRPEMGGHGGGASVVVRARESRVHGEGKQEVDALVVAEETPVDSGYQDEQSWLLNVQGKLYQWSRKMDEQTRLRSNFWRAGCVSKGARPVRREGVRNRWPKCHTALTPYSPHETDSYMER